MFILFINKYREKMLIVLLVILGFSLVQQNSIFVNQLNLPVPIEKVATKEKVMALTVNVDWGEEQIPSMLELFDQYEAKVTFFVTGKWAEKNPGLIKSMAERGHSIQNHGYFHSHPDQQAVAKNKEELIRTEEVIIQLLGKKPNFYAPPYGERGKNGLIAADELGYKTILWTLDTIDWRTDSTPELISQRVLRPKIRHGLQPEKNGAIVLMHPKENTVRALPKILSTLREEGYQLVTIEKLITFQ